MLLPAGGPAHGGKVIYYKIALNRLRTSSRLDCTVQTPGFLLILQNAAAADCPRLQCRAIQRSHTLAYPRGAARRAQMLCSLAPLHGTCTITW